MTVYDFTVTTNKGEEKSLSDYKGKVLLIVNTASKCGLTPQYQELQELYETHHILVDTPRQRKIVLGAQLYQ